MPEDIYEYKFKGWYTPTPREVHAGLCGGIDGRIVRKQFVLINCRRCDWFWWQPRTKD